MGRMKKLAELLTDYATNTYAFTSHFYIYHDRSFYLLDKQVRVSGDTVTEDTMIDVDKYLKTIFPTNVLSRHAFETSTNILGDDAFRNIIDHYQRIHPDETTYLYTFRRLSAHDIKDRLRTDFERFFADTYRSYHRLLARALSETHPNSTSLVRKINSNSNL